MHEPARICRVADHLGARPEEFLPAIPYLLGFAPDDSLVCIAHTEDSPTVTATARVDFGAARAAPVQVARSLAQRARNCDSRHVFLVAVDVREAACEETLAAVTDALAETGVTTTWAGMLAGSVWRSVRCEGAGCPPHVVPAVPSMLVTQLVLAGRSPAASRAAVLEELRGPSADLVDCRADPMEWQDTERWRDRTIESFGAVLDSGIDPDDEKVRMIARACADIRVRDTVLWRLTHAAEHDSDVWQPAWRVISHALRRCPTDVRAEVAAVAAVVAWQCGDGLRATEVLNQAWDADRSHSLAALVRQALDHGLPPEVWQEVMFSLTEEECRWGSGRAA